QYNTTQQTKKPSRRRQEHFNGILDDTFDDGSFIVTKSRRKKLDQLFRDHTYHLFQSKQ
ncbi:unnamed protein product, partial [Rotaria magnacalcarata]